MTVHYEDERLTLRLGDARDEVEQLETGSVQTVVTSPPYFGLRDYGEPGQYGTEATVADYVDRLVELFHEIRRVLADDGTVWLNLGDTYSSRYKGTGGTGKSTLGARHGNTDKQAERSQLRQQSTPRRLELGVAEKNLLGVPWRVAFALQADGWILRSEVVWSKPNAMPESVTDRPSRSHEHLFLLAKRPTYFYDADAIAETYDGDRAASRRARSGTVTKENSIASAYEPDAGGRRNKRTVWTVSTVPFTGAHFATFPPSLVRPCVLASTRPGDVVLDPFSGSGTTGQVALEESRRYVGIDLSATYLDLSLAERFTERPLDLYAGGAA